MASPFIVRSTENAGAMLYDLLTGLAVIILGFLSFWDRTRWAHFLLLLVAAWLIGSGFAAGHPSPPSAQNHVVVGIVLGMFAIIPNRANDLPAAWRRYYDI